MQDGVAVATVDKIYDELSLDEQDFYDAIAKEGFRPEMDGSRWTAVSNLTGFRVGPFPTLAELHKEVCSFTVVSDDVIDGEVIADNSTSNEGRDKTPVVTEDGGDGQFSDEGEKTATTFCGTPGPNNDGEFCRRNLEHDGPCSVSGAEPLKATKKVSVKPPTGLSLADVAVWSQIKGLGFAAYKDDDGRWAAEEIEGGYEIGNAPTIDELLNALKEHLTDDTEITLDVEPTTKQPFLPGAAAKVNKQLSNAIIAQHEAKMARVEATAKETAANKSMEIAGNLHEDLYEIDPDKPNTMVYHVGKITSRIIVTEDRKFVTEQAKGDEE